MVRLTIAKRSLLAAALVGGGLAAAPAQAQTAGAADAVAQCRDLPNDSERILCLEQALLADPPSAAATAAPAAAPAAPPAPQPDASPTFERRGGLRLPGIPFIGGGSDGDAPVEQVVSSDDPEADQFGAAALAVRERREGRGEPEVVPRLAASVVDAEVVPYKRLQVELDNGQIWRQTQADSADYNLVRYGDPEGVEIWPSHLGGYRMAIAQTNLTLKVERVR